MNMRIDTNGKTIHEGDQIVVGREDKYVCLCRKHFFEKLFSAQVSEHVQTLPDVTANAVA